MYKLVVTGGSKKLHRIAVRSENLSPVFWKVRPYLESEVAKQFATEGAHFGTPWEPLKPATKREKALAGFGGKKILVRTGALRSSFLNIYEVSARRLEFGSDDEKALWHQKGTHRDGKRVNPPRPMLKATEAIENHIADEIKDYLMRGLRDV